VGDHATASAGETEATGSTSGWPNDESKPTSELSSSSSTVTSVPYTGTPLRVWRNLTVRVPVNGTVSVLTAVKSLTAPAPSGAVKPAAASLARAWSRWRRAAVSGSRSARFWLPSGRKSRNAACSDRSWSTVADPAAS
jgi:hypothetical protein